MSQLSDAVNTLVAALQALVVPGPAGPQGPAGIPGSSGTIATAEGLFQVFWQADNQPGPILYRIMVPHDPPAPGDNTWIFPPPDADGVVWARWGHVLSVQALPLLQTVVNIGTGISPQGALGSGAVDPNFVMISSADPSLQGQRLFIMAGPWPGWIGWPDGDSNSQWISPSADSRAQPGTYVHRMTFDLTGYDQSTVQAGGNWASDDTATMKFNGTLTTFQTTLGHSLSPFTLSGPFLPGINTIDFTVTNAGSTVNSTGLRVAFTYSGMKAQP